MQLYLITMEGKLNFFIWNGLIVDRLTRPRLMFLWNALRLVQMYRFSYKFNNSLRTSLFSMLVITRDFEECFSLIQTKSLRRMK